MLFDVIFTDEAEDTFDSIGNQILERWGERELVKFRTRAYNIVEIISKSPLIFQAIDTTGNLRKAVIHKTVHCFIESKTKELYYYSFGTIARNLCFNIN